MRTRFKGRGWRAVVLLATFLLVAAACGDDDAPAVQEPAAQEPAAPEPAAPEPAAQEPAAPEPAAPEPAAPEPAAPGGELVIAVATAPNALDVVNSAERNASNVAWQLFDSLVWINDDAVVEPALASSWDVSDDGKVYTFTLRQGVTFHNGEPFNADAVVFSWEVGKNPENQYFDQWERAESVVAIDEFTVQVTTTDVNALFLRQMSTGWAMYPPAYYTEVGRVEFGQKPIGTGPFMLVEWLPGDRIVMDKNPNYWREGWPKLDRITFRPITDSSVRAAAIRTGEVDIVNRLSPDEAAQVEGSAGVNVINYPKNRVYYVAFNNLTTGVGQPTENKLVRQAMNYAVDVRGIIDALFAGKGRQATGFVTPGDFGFDDSLTPYPYDPVRARELLTQAGFPDGFTMNMACPSGAYTNFEQVCEAVAAQLNEVGIAVTLNLQESGAYWDLEASKELPPLFGDSWSATIGEAFDRLTGALGGFDASFSAWSDPTIDGLLDDIIQAVDQDKRAALYAELQAFMFDDPPFIYLYEPFAFEAISDKVVNYKPRAAEEYWLWDLQFAG